MRIIVVHEDGDRESRINDLAEEIRICVKTGTTRYQASPFMSNTRTGCDD
jgi:hypothetical protein